MNGNFLSALSALCAQHGMTYATKGDTVTVTDTSAAATQLARDGRHYGLEAQDYGATFTQNGKRYKLTGVKLSRPKYPLSAEELGTGRPFKFTTSVLPQIVAQRGSQPTTQQTAQAPTTMQTPAPAQQHNPYAEAAQF